MFETGNQSVASSIGRYEYLIMAQQWPPTVCMTLNCKSEKNRTVFGIHGLWPEPCKLCTNQTYHEMPELEDKLQKQWPNLVKGEEDEVFWKKEWIKHGNCSLDKFNQTEYFNLTLGIKDEVDLLKLLEQGGIMPSDDTKYPLVNIVNAVKVGINNSVPGILCYYKINETSNYKINETYNLLQEIRVCLDADGRYINCPPKKQAVNCKKDVKITLPMTSIFI